MSHPARVKVAALVTSLFVAGLIAMGIGTRSDPPEPHATTTASRVVEQTRTIEEVKPTPRRAAASAAPQPAQVAAVPPSPATSGRGEVFRVDAADQREYDRAAGDETEDHDQVEAEDDEHESGED